MRWLILCVLSILVAVAPVTAQGNGYGQGPYVCRPWQL